MINLKEVLQKVDVAGTDLDGGRVPRTLELLTELLGESVFIAEEELQCLPDRMKSHWKEKDVPRATVSNEFYRLRKALRFAAEQGLLGVHDVRFQTGIPTFKRPNKKGPEQRRHDALGSFERWCAERRISLDDIGTNTFREYREWLRESNLSAARKESLYLDLVRLWREKSDEGLLPKLELPRWKDESSARYGLPREQWPTKCRASFDAFGRGAKNQARDGEKRWRTPLRQVSIDGMEKEIAQLLGYLRNVRSDLKEQDDLLNILRNPKNLIGFIEWHIKERCGGEERGYHKATLEQLADLLVWLGGEKEIADRYRRIANSLDPVRVRDPFPKRPMDYDEFVHGAMKALREKRTIFENAQGLQARVRAACNFRDAFLLAFVICRPLRSRNLRQMELGKNVYKEGDAWFLRFLSHEAKARSYRCEFPPRLILCWEFYLNHVRPVLLKKTNVNTVFLTKSGRPLSPQDLWRRLRQIGEEYLGIPTNPHAFRYLIPSAYLIKHLGAITEMQALLGHGVVQTTLRRYVHTHSRIASLTVAAAIRKHCPNFTRLASLYPKHD